MPIVDPASAFLVDMGETATVITQNGSQRSGVVLLDAPDQTVLGDLSIGRSTKATFATASFPALSYDDLMTIGNRSYRVETVQQIDDGVFSEAMITLVDEEDAS